MFSFPFFFLSLREVGKGEERKAFAFIGDDDRRRVMMTRAPFAPAWHRLGRVGSRWLAVLEKYNHKKIWMICDSVCSPLKREIETHMRNVVCV